MRRTVLSVAAVGVVLPFLARLPGGAFKGGAWLHQYLEPGVLGWMFLEAFNLIAVLVGAGVTALLYRRKAWVPAVLAGYGFLAFAHGTLDLASDAQAAVALVFIPILAVPFFAGGAGIGLVVRWAVEREPRESARR